MDAKYNIYVINNENNHLLSGFNIKKLIYHGVMITIVEVVYN